MNTVYGQNTSSNHWNALSLGDTTYTNSATSGNLCNDYRVHSDRNNYPCVQHELIFTEESSEYSTICDDSCATASLAFNVPSIATHAIEQRMPLLSSATNPLPGPSEELLSPPSYDTPSFPPFLPALTPPTP